MARNSRKIFYVFEINGREEKEWHRGSVNYIMKFVVKYPKAFVYKGLIINGVFYPIKRK